MSPTFLDRILGIGPRDDELFRPVREGLLVRCDHEAWVLCRFPKWSNSEAVVAAPSLDPRHRIALALASSPDGNSWLVVPGAETCPLVAGRLVTLDERRNVEQVTVEPRLPGELVIDFIRIPFTVFLGASVPVARIMRGPRFNLFYGGIVGTVQDLDSPKAPWWREPPTIMARAESTRADRIVLDAFKVLHAAVIVHDTRPVDGLSTWSIPGEDD